MIKYRIDCRTGRMNSKGQVSTELLVIIGFVLMLFIPLLFYTYYKTRELDLEIAGMESRLISSKLAFIANSMGSLGDGNSIKIEVSLPAHVRTLNFINHSTGGEVKIILWDENQISQVTTFPFNETNSYSGGANYKLEFISNNGKITVRALP